MILNQGKSAFVASLCKFTESTFKAKRTDGRIETFPIQPLAEAWSAAKFKGQVSGSSGSTMGSVIVFGSGSAEVHPDDYKMSEPIPVQGSYRVVSSTTSASTSGMNFTNTLTSVVEWQGDTTTISEIGLYFGYSDYGYLLARELLQSPITVNNGDTFTVSMKLG